MPTVRTHGDVVQTIKVGESLRIGLVFDEFFRTTVKETDVLQIGISRVGGSSSTRTHWVNSKNFLSVEFHNHTKYTVSSRVLRTMVQSEYSSLEEALNTHPKLTVHPSIHIKKRTKSDTNIPVKCLSFASARVPVSANISAADMPCRSSTVCVSKGFLAPFVGWTSGFHRAGDVEKERKTVRFGRTSCRRNNTLAIVVVVVEDEVVGVSRRKSVVAMTR